MNLNQILLTATNTQSEISCKNNLLLENPWLIFAIAACAFLGGIAGFFMFSYALKKNKADYIKITDDNVTSEIIGLRSRIQIIYIIGPLLAIIISYLGINTYSDIRKIRDRDITEKAKAASREWLDQKGLEQQLSLLKETAAQLEMIKKEGVVVTESDVENVIKVKGGEYFVSHYGSVYNPSHYKVFFKRYLSEKNIKSEQKTLEKINLKINDLDEKIRKEFDNLPLKYLSLPSYETNLNRLITNENSYLTESKLKPNIMFYISDHIQSFLQEDEVKQLIRESPKVLAVEDRTSNVFFEELLNDYMKTNDFQTQLQQSMSNPEIVNIIKQKLSLQNDSNANEEGQ